MGILESFVIPAMRVFFWVCVALFYSTALTMLGMIIKHAVTSITAKVSTASSQIEVTEESRVLVRG